MQNGEKWITKIINPLAKEIEIVSEKGGRAYSWMKVDGTGFMHLKSDWLKKKKKKKKKKFIPAFFLS
jgi:hypothetical protein